MPITWAGKPAIWMAWPGDDPIPDLLQLCLESVRRHNAADFHVILVTPANMPEFIAPHPAFDALSLVHRADYLRLALLHHYGGIYLDMDTIALRSMSDLYADLAEYDLITYNGATWGELIGVSVFGPTRRESALTSAWDAAVRNLLDRRGDELMAYRARDANPRADGLKWNELLSTLIQPIARQLHAAGKFSLRLLDPTWAHFAHGGPAYGELFIEGSPRPPDTELLILNNSLYPGAIRAMSANDILHSDLGICRLLQRALGNPEATRAPRLNGRPRPERDAYSRRKARRRSRTRQADPGTETAGQRTDGEPVPALTIGMVTGDDVGGVQASIQALRFYQDLVDTELLVIDTHGCNAIRDVTEGVAGGRYILAPEAPSRAVPFNLLFHEARGKAVLCCAPDVLLAPGAITRLKAYYQAHPYSLDLLHGPRVHDDLQGVVTHLRPEWRGLTWGVPETDPRGLDPEGEPFEIPMQSLGVFSCRQNAWPGRTPLFRGVGGEEGYLHEKVRLWGGRSLCLPWLRWSRRLGQPSHISGKDALWNAVVGHTELGWDLQPALEHFAGSLRAETIAAVAEEALQAHNRLLAEPATRKNTIKAPVSGASLPFISIAESEDSALPLISCICPTYNRPPGHSHLVEEAIESFLRQTYPNKELILLNDCPGQELVVDAPGVRVVNVAERFPTIGDKRNAAIALARGELIAPWDDDDIHLPWRLSLLVERLGSADSLDPESCWLLFANEQWPKPHRGGVYSKAIFRRSAWEAVGGYPSRSHGEDFDLLRAIEALGNQPDPSARYLSRREFFLIYRWGISPIHLSGRKGEGAYDDYLRFPVQAGTFVLRPHWRRDYVDVVRRQIETGMTPGDHVAKAQRELAQFREAHGIAPPEALYVIDARRKRSRKAGRVREFPLLAAKDGEAPEAHLARVVQAVNAAMDDGGTHLLIPRAAAHWLLNHPLLEEYFSARHEFVEGSNETGIVFALRR